MSAVFILEYGGCPLQIRANGMVATVTEREASQFVSEADAWIAATKLPLLPEKNLRVVNLYERDQAACARPLTSVLSPDGGEEAGTAGAR